MDAVIIYESLTGNTRVAARAMADALFDRGVPSTIFAVGEIDAEVVAASELVIIGSWTDGALIVGQRPGKAGKLRKQLPDLTGKKAVVFCTYAITPGKTLDKLGKIVEGRGAQVVGGLAIRRNELQAGAGDLVERTMAVMAS